ncbi:MAG: thioredoxin family protein [Flavobacteriaceae bacterium]|nr:thioredoxin family protein [Flavobacteriaceae bacterium]
MKKLNTIALFICVIFAFNSCKSTKNTTVEVAKVIPYFSFATLDRKPFVKNSLDTVRTKLFFYFNSECDHCQKQGKWLSKEIDVFKDLEMIFISYEQKDAIREYRDKYSFTQENITFVEDYRLTFSNLFGAETFPSILIYSKKGKLIKSFKEETKVSEIWEVIQ